jgi:hypothetical protein
MFSSSGIASSMVVSRRSAMDLPLYFTDIVSRL